uniref:Uncharacterized protein n=1 Tax=Heterorhabditis bacteriophora TaxID=37862 RepID=A0A1I7WZ22_HETBA
MDRYSLTPLHSRQDFNKKCIELLNEIGCVVCICFIIFYSDLSSQSSLIIYRSTCLRMIRWHSIGDVDMLIVLQLSTQLLQLQFFLFWKTSKIPNLQLKAFSKLLLALLNMNVSLSQVALSAYTCLLNISFLLHLIRI